MKRFLVPLRVGLLSALLVFSSLVGSLLPFLSNNAYAASVWDYSVVNTETLQLREGGFGSVIDVTNDWAARVISGPGALTETERSDFEQAYTSGSYSVSQYKNTDGYLRVFINYDVDAGRTIVPCGASPYFDCASPAIGQPGFRIANPEDNIGQIFMYVSSGGSYVATSGWGGQVAYQLSTQSLEPFETNMSVTYPPGYQGNDIGVPSVYLNPPLSYTVFKNVVTIKHIGNGCIQDPQNASSCPIPRINYGVQLDDGDFEYQTLLVGETYQFTAKEWGHYNFTALYVDSGIPYAPLPSSFEYRTTTIQIYVDGVNNYSSDTTMCPTDSGFTICQEVSPYEDCLSYGLDVGGAVGCHLRNLTVAWESMLNRLFVPQPTYFNSYFDQFGTYLNNKLGFIYSSIASVFLILGGVISGAATTSCAISPPGTLFGTSVSFNVCSFQTVIGNTPFVAIQTLIIGITVVTLVFAGIRKYQEVVSQR